MEVGLNNRGFSLHLQHLLSDLQIYALITLRTPGDINLRY